MRKRSKQLLGLSFMVAVVLLFGVTVQVIEARRTPAWQSALARVVSPTAVVAVAHARQPETFRLADTYKIRDGNRFAYEHHDETGDLLHWMVPLPASPRDVYCVIVRRSKKERLFFVNYYTDNLYRSGWVVIDGGALPLDQALTSQLAAIDCRLSRRG